MHLLHVHSGNLFGGVERILEALAGAGPSSPVHSTFALCFEGRVSATLREAGATVHLLGDTHVRRPWEVLRARRRLRGVLQEGAYDVAMVHSSWSQAIFGPTIAAARVPLVRWFHAPDRGPGWMERWAERSRPAFALYNSRYTWHGAHARMQGVPGEVLYPLARTPPVADSDSRAATRRALSTPEGQVVIAMASRVEPLKGHRLLIEALAQIAHREWEAWIIGGAQRPEEDRYLSELRQAARAAGLDARVRFLGERSDVGRLMAAADIYCQPNARPEAFGLSFVEALAAGLPVVTTRMGAAAEIVDDTCGVLVEPASPSELAAALERLVGDERLRRRLGDNGRRRASVFCDLPASFTRLADTLRAVVGVPVTAS